MASNELSPSAKEMARYLATIRDSINNDLRPELQSDSARRHADALILVLGRLVERVTSDGALMSQIENWDAILTEMPYAQVDHIATTSLDVRDNLEKRLSQLQITLPRAGSTDHLNAKNSDGLRWLRSVSHAAANLWEAIEDNLPGPCDGNTLTSSKVDVTSLCDKLNEYLSRRFPELPEKPVLSLDFYYGGYGKQSGKLTLRENNILPRTMVLRRDLAFSNTNTLSSDEFPVIKIAYELGLPVPRPILAETNSTVLGGTFMLMEEIANAEVAGATFAEDRAQKPGVYGPEFGRDIARILAKLHAKTVIATRTPVQLLETHGAFIEEIGHLRDEWETLDKPPLSVCVDLGFSLLLANPLTKDRPHCLVHADCGMHNWLVRDGRPAALLDWELSHHGDPAEDMAIIRMLTADDVIPWTQFVEEYIANGGIPAACDPWAVAYHSVLLLNRHTLMASRVRGVYHSDIHNDAIAASVASHIVDRLLHYQAKALQLASDTLSAQRGIVKW